ncbi:MAG TPA: LD-carboxypeptidase [Fimbriimonadaceae bacterium]|nr:LD-carboxypeptidase [Fimbriimonadaceae bacterium]
MNFRGLRPGDLIQVVSPSSPLAPEKIQRAVTLLEEEGYRVRISPNAFLAEGFLAGPDAVRAADLHAAFDDPEVAAVFCTRGGYGAGRLMPLLDYDRIAASGKLFIGFSDATVIHLALNRRGVPTAYAPMGITLSVDREPWVIESFKRVLRGDLVVPPDALRAECVVPGVASGLTTGGCLCLICDSVGTPEAIDARGKILFIEDVDESAHRFDAMLTHLLNASIIQQAAGIVIGENTDEKVDEKIGFTAWKEIAIERLAGLGIPMVVGYPFGHMKTMLSVPFGVQATLDASAGKVSYLTK